MTTVAEALAATRGRLPPAEARLLMGHVLQRPAAWLLAHDDDQLDADALTAFASFCARRGAGEPVAYLVGTREFYGRSFRVAPGVLIPRPETELLVEQVLATLPEPQTARLLDLGTGSGCIAITLALERPQCEVWATDRSADALAIAGNNAQRFGAAVRFAAGDWLAALPATAGRFDIIVSNPPYIATADPHLALGDLRFEPAEALASGADGLDAIRRIIAAAPDYLRPGGWLWLEHGYDQAEGVAALLQATGYVDVSATRDLGGHLRISGGRRTAEPPADQALPS